MYVDGFVMAVPKARLGEYKSLAEKSRDIWKKHGAVDYVECVADDVKPGKLTSFPQAVMLKDDEVVIFAWITYPSREARDRVNAAVMAEPWMQAMKPEDMPFDGQRMFWGGFESIVQG
ncbi:MAG: DUF1428 domain-containing protein [Xanthomonadaceae bacterium]|nr:DUF1428 domain-containing protein [Xanthomonadaceae bacterium]